MFLRNTSYYHYHFDTILSFSRQTKIFQTILEDSYDLHTKKVQFNLVAKEYILMA